MFVRVVPEQVLIGYEGTFDLSDTAKRAWLTEKVAEATLVLTSHLGPLDVWADTEFRVQAIEMVIKRVVRRVLRNPTGIFSETAGDYSYQRDRAAGGAGVTVAADDWALLGVKAPGSGGVGTIRTGHEFRGDGSWNC